jgi:hypothetical protein
MEGKNVGVEVRTDPHSDSRLRRGLYLAAEVTLILTIVGLLIAIWLPAWIVPH